MVTLEKRYHLDLDIRSKGIKSEIIYVQGDTNVYPLELCVMDGGKAVALPTGATATVTMRKDDGNTVIGSAEIVDYENGLVEYAVGSNDIACPGNVSATLEILAGDQRLTTCSFKFKVVECLDEGDAIESTTEYSVLQDLISQFPDSSEFATQDELTAHTTAPDIHITAAERTSWNGKQDAAEAAGIRQEGQTVTPEQGTSVTAGTGAEIFNDYRNRTFDNSGNANRGNVASGNYAHAEGSGATASGGFSHAEGYGTTAAGNSAHAEGGVTKATGNYAHSEGVGTVASGTGAHAQNLETEAIGENSSAAGNNTVAAGANSFIVGVNGTAGDGVLFGVANGTGKEDTSLAFEVRDDNKAYVGGKAVAAQEDVDAKADADKLIGKNLTGQTVWPTKDISLIAKEGAEIFNDYLERTYYEDGTPQQGNIASGFYSHAEGCATTASNSYTHAEGGVTTAKGMYAHAEGAYTTARGGYSHAEGYRTIADISYAHAEGDETTAEGIASHAEGIGTIAHNVQHVHGRYNIRSYGPADIETDMTGDIFIVGNGTGDEARGNALRTTTAGKTYGLDSFAGSGADYAEYFEWSDGNVGQEDRRGLFVTLEGEKIRPAEPGDKYILGIVSATPMVEGDAQSEIWKGMYVTDVFGCKVTEEVEIAERTDEETGEVTPAHTATRWVTNPEYDPAQEYVRREERPEWSPVGLMGKLVAVDDGTCEVDGYCMPGERGVATASENGYRVMARLDDTHVRVLVK